MNERPAAPLRAALLGTGDWARVLATAARDCAQLQIIACWGRTPERVQAFAANLGITAYTEVDDLWRDPRLDAVIVALPNDRHRDYATLAAMHRKHVFIEKPIAHTLADGLAMLELERTHGIRLAVGHCARMLTGNRLLAQAIRDGDLGRITHLEVKFANDRGLKLTPKDWRWYQASAPGGPLSQIAIHQFDTLRALGGDLVAVSARGARLSPVGAEVEDQWVVAVEFADGKLGSLVASWTSPGVHSVRATGDRASLFYEVDQTLWSQPQRLHEHAVLERQERGQGPGTRTRLPVPPGNMLRDELDLFADCIVRNQPCELSGDNACQALAAVDAALVSAQRGGAAVRLDEMMGAARERLRANEPSDSRGSQLPNTVFPTSQ
jgi:predicted dehydrogenase